MGQLFTVFNNKSSLDLDLIAHIPEIAPSQRRYGSIDNNFRDAVFYRDYKSRTEIIIKQQFEFIEYDFENWQSRFRIIKKWLNKITDNKLKFSDDLGFFYLANKVEIDTPSREAYRNGKFTVTFYCDSYMYLEEGTSTIELPSELFNDYEECCPVYRIEGEGICDFIINDITFKVNVSDHVNIDIKNGQCYKDSLTPKNTTLSGHYKDMKLKEGNNTFSITNGFKGYITPYWRCL